MGLFKDAQGREIDDRYIRAGGDSSGISPVRRWVGRRFTYVDLTDGDLSQDIAAFACPANTIVHDVALLVETDFAGGSIASLTVALGPSGGDADGLLEEASVFTGVANNVLLSYNTQASRGVLLWDPTAGDEHPLFGYDVGTADINLDAQFVSTSGNLNTATAGSCIIYICISNPLDAAVKGSA